jgi:hypothetical protein
VAAAAFPCDREREREREGEIEREKRGRELICADLNGFSSPKGQLPLLANMARELGFLNLKCEKT